MLVGRDAEQERIAALMAGARVRRSGVLVLRGEAGIGKTALLEDTARRRGGMRLLRVAGSEYESGLGFAALHQLLRPALDLLDRIPGPQRDALAVALTLREGPPPERFAVGAAALSLLSRCAEEGPMLLLVDDAHLLDLPSAETLRFVARRLVVDPVALIILMRPSPDSVLCDAGLPAHDLAGLDLAAATKLLDATTGTSSAGELAVRLHPVTAGNPLALVELAAHADRLDRLSPAVPVPVPARVAAAFAGRFTALDEPAQRALLLAVVADGDLALTARAAAGFGCEVDALAAAELSGLLRIGPGRADFRHPLVRSAVYASTEAGLRRAAHRAIAAALPPDSQDRRAWHLSEACVGPDDTVADALAGTAERAGARGAYGTAALALTRSAQLSTVDSVRGMRLLGAADAAWLGGRIADADVQLREAAALLTEPRRLAEIDGIRGNLALRTGSPRTAHDLLAGAAARIESVDPDMSVLLLAGAVSACFYLCDTASGLADASSIERLLPRCESVVAGIRGRMAIGIARVLAGVDGMSWIRDAVEEMTGEPDRFEDPRRPYWTVVGPLFLRQAGAGRKLAGVVAEQRAKAALGVLPNLLFHNARDDATTDRWSAALAEFDESIALARESGQLTDLAMSLAGLAWLQARMGRAGDCRANCAESLLLAHSHDVVLAEVWSQFALGDLSLAAGDAAGALGHFERVCATMARIGFGDVDVEPGAELAEARLRLGEMAAASHCAGDYLQRARHKGQPWALARACRAMALCTADHGAQVTLFEKALEHHAGTLDLYEEARTRLAFGSALRRGRSRVQARPQLRTALDQFERLGARPWADLAALELEATGEHARRAGDNQLSALTAQEISIARLLAGGRTTKEAAAALFLSPKTVEYHLRHIYQKLQIGSRAELGRVVDDTGPAD